MSDAPAPTIAMLHPLTTKGWESAREAAEEIIRRRIGDAPTRDQFAVVAADRPVMLTRITFALLLILALAGFYLSAGKEIVSLDLVMNALVAGSPARLSPAYATIGIIAALAFAEVGVIMFGLAAHEHAAHRRLAIGLRAFQILGMFTAVAANVTTTALYHSDQAALFDWLMTLAPPVITIGISLILEEAANDWITRHAAATRAFNAASEAYRLAQADPTKHPDWLDVWGAAIVDQAGRQSKHNRELIDLLIDADPTIRNAIASREWQRHQWHFNPSLALAPSGTAGMSAPTGIAGTVAPRGIAGTVAPRGIAGTVAPRGIAGMSARLAPSGTTGTMPVAGMVASAASSGTMPPATQRAYDMLVADPELAAFSSRELEARYEIGRNNWNAARRHLASAPATDAPIFDEDETRPSPAAAEEEAEAS